MRYLILVCTMILVSFNSVCRADSQHPGIYYRNYQLDANTLIHVLTIDPTKLKIIAARAQDAGYPLSSVEAIAKHFSAIAAINGGFFRLDQPTTGAGLAAGVLKINNLWHGIAYKARGSIGWDPENNTVLVDRLQTASSLEINQQRVPINSFNRFVTDNKSCLLSDSFREPISANTNVVYVFKDNRISEIYTGQSKELPMGSYAYSVSNINQAAMAQVKVGDIVNLRIKALPQLAPANAELWDKLPFVVGGGPVLIYNSSVIHDYSKEKMRADFIDQLHARTAIGILANKHWVLVSSSGMTIPALGKFMHSLGCVYAVNLDGGGSTAMYYASASLIDNTNFGRPVSDAILVLERIK